MKTIVYINLTTGLEELAEMKRIFPDGEIHFSHIQSTHLEHSDYKAFLQSIDNDFLMNLALNNTVVFVDCGSRHLDGVPRTIYQGLPFLRFVCHKIWFNKDLPNECYIKDYNAHATFNKVFNELFRNSSTRDQRLYNKFRYFRKFAREKYFFNVVATSLPSKFDGKPEEFQRILQEQFPEEK